MDSRARKVQAERNRRRLPRRPTASRWARRIAGLVATAVFIGVGVAIALMVMPETGNEQAAVAAAPTATAAKSKQATKKKPRKPKGPSKAERAALKAAVADVRAQGYTTLKQSDYDYKATLRVLIGRPVGDTAGGHRAFFFTKGRFLGNDALAPSTTLTVARKGKRTVTLSYGVYQPGDSPGAPSGRKRVRFRLEGTQIRALDTIPLESARFQRRQG